MIKFIAVLVALAFASSVLAFNPFTNLFETLNVKRGFGQENVCCLPPVFSVKGALNQVSLSSNSTLKPTTGVLTGFFDYISGKIRQDLQQTIDDEQANYSTYVIKISNTLSVSYTINDNDCDCFKNEYPNQWEPICIPAQGTISKIKIGNYEGRRVSNKQHDVNVDMWLFSAEEYQFTDKCWMLNTQAVTSNVVQEITYYDQVQKVDPNVFKVPSQCPTIEKCLAKP